ncbi:MAG: glycosyltransferase family 4 protein [Candidatus Sumerlaeia bacterium]|nr:glycosyltransferase family 4 protein [Candidatus Sumerlaeia bacterium]
MSARLAIGYDGSSTLAPRTGIGRAALDLLRALAALEASDLDIHVLLNSLTRRLGPEHRLLADRVHLVRRRRLGGRLVQAWARGHGPVAEDLLGVRVALWHAVSSCVPPVHAARRVVTVHDLAFLDEAPTARARLGGALFHDSFPRLLPACDAVVTPTQAVRARLIETYGLPEDRVVAIPWGLDAERFHVEPERLVEIACHDFGIPKASYLLAVGDHQPRKRAGLLLDLYARLRAAEPATPPLVLLGWNGHPPAELRARHDLHRHVLVLPRVPDDKLAGLYTGAVATVLTSRDEGFGFPLLEAQACGSPVVASACPAWREIAGSDARLVASNDPDAWIEALRPLVFDQQSHDAAKAAGLANAARFSWEACALAHAGLYRRLAS